MTLLLYTFSLIYRKIEDELEDDPKEQNGTNLAIATIERTKDSQILSLEPTEEPTKRRRARFCPTWKKRGACRPQELKDNNYRIRRFGLVISIIKEGVS